MTNEKFQKFTEKLKIKAEKNPRWYKTKVFGLAMVGYLYLFVVLAILFAVVGIVVYSIYTKTFHLIFAKLLIPVFVLLYVLVKSLWIHIEAPTGLRLDKQNTPLLIEEIERMRKQLKGFKVDEIQLNNDFNAAIIQVPRLGVFGWYKNILVVGLPLMMALSKEQFQAVLAHELGHLSGAHGRFST
ncbi:M48 family metalloprotease [Paenibacillus sp. N3.4]|nr:M48 family metalloprotease [Paenibacillus sp. N3.4]